MGLSQTYPIGLYSTLQTKILYTETQKEAKEIIDIYNEFYHLLYPKEKWIERSVQVCGRLERKLRKIERNNTGISNALLLKALATRSMSSVRSETSSQTA